MSAKASGKVIVFTDGACSGNPGPGGWAAVLVSPLGKVREIGGAAPHTTNNKMELTATLEALRSLSAVKQLSTKEIKLYTDAKYVIQGITQWIHGWKRNGWKNAEGKEVANRELWEALAEEILRNNFKVEWLYVPGHMGFPGNERCDEIAVAFSKGYGIELFQGDRAQYRVNVDHLPPAASLSSSGSKEKKGKPLYLSYVNGSIYRDKDWKTCEGRVKGKAGARFKKVSSPEEEASVLKAWGIRASRAR